MAVKQRRLSRREKRRQERDSDHMISVLNTKFGMKQIKPLTPMLQETSTGSSITLLSVS